MNLVAVTMVKDEAEIIGHTVAHLLRQGVDAVVVADNGSTDGTVDALAPGGRVHVIDDPEIGYWQSQKMTKLAEIARLEHDADWVIPFDADEFWTSLEGDTLRDTVNQADAAGYNLLAATIVDHVPTAMDPDDGPPQKRIGWRRRQPAPLFKVAMRAEPGLQIHQGNHSASTPVPHGYGLLRVRHFPYRSPEQMIRKARNGARAYAHTDLPFHVGQHWREYGAMTDEQITEVFHRWFYSPKPDLDPTLIYDPLAR
jgi:hypothetical protein